MRERSERISENEPADPVLVQPAAPPSVAPEAPSEQGLKWLDALLASEENHWRQESEMLGELPDGPRQSARSADLYRWLRAALPGLLRAEREREALLRFAGEALCDARLEDIGDWDGGAIQDALESCGLITLTARVVPCGDECRCAEFYDSGDTARCYPLAPLGQAAVVAYRAWQDAERAAAVVPAPEEPEKRAS